MTVAGSRDYTRIAQVWVIAPDGKASSWTVAQAVQFIKSGGKMITDHNGARAEIHVNKTADGREFIQTIADGKWSDNLLALPEYN
jgi:hypothetical protein